MVILFALLPLAIHEIGHYVAALLFGSRIRFAFEWGNTTSRAGRGGGLISYPPTG